MKRKVISFLRVSTDAQDTARQGADVARVIAANDLDVLRTLELIDVSGCTVLQNRDVQAMLRDLKRPDVAGVAVSALDRLFRPNLYSDFAILDPFRETGKLIFSAKEGVLDPATDMGFMMSLMSGAQAGMEWRELRRRTLGGKAEKRKLGRNVNGTATLPDGLGYERIANSSGKTIDHKWFYEEPYAGAWRKAYDMLFAGENYSAIARELRRIAGGKWVGHNVRSALQNPAWKGVRRYSDGSEITLPIEPLISPARWEEAQRLMSQRYGSWSKQVRQPRFLAAGLLVCECGRKYYFHSDGRRGHHDNYYCASRYPKGPGCGSGYLWRKHVDAAVETIVIERLTDATFLINVFTRKQALAPDTTDRERQLQKLKAKRERFIDAYGEGRLSKQEFNERLDAIADAVREIEMAIPTAPTLVPDTKRAIAGLARFAARFSKLPFETKRSELKRLLRRIDVVDGAIPGFTLSGAFLTEFSHTNSAPRSRRLYWRRSRARA